MKLGELLLVLKLVSQDQVDKAVQFAVHSGLPLGRALVLSGYLNDEDLALALEIQSLMQTANIPLGLAQKAVTLMRQEGLSLDAAFERLGMSSALQNQVSFSKLGNLLCAANAISREQLAQAQRASFETGLKLGKVLVMMKAITQHFLANSLETQRMLRDGRITYAQAVESLSLAAPSVAPIEEAVARQGINRKSRKAIRLGELLLLSGVLTEMDVMTALEAGLTERRPLGDVLMELGLLDQGLLDLALELQQNVCSGMLDVNAAINTLHYVAVTGRGMAGEMADYAQGPNPAETAKLGELLERAGILRQEEVKKALELATRYPSLIGRMLVAAGSIDEASLLAALRCQFLLRNGFLSIDEAARALAYACRNQLCLDDALEELGISLPLPRHKGPAERKSV